MAACNSVGLGASCTPAVAANAAASAAARSISRLANCRQGFQSDISSQPAAHLHNRCAAPTEPQGQNAAHQICGTCIASPTPCNCAPFHGSARAVPHQRAPPAARRRRCPAPGAGLWATACGRWQRPRTPACRCRLRKRVGKQEQGVHGAVNEASSGQCNRPAVRCHVVHHLS